MIRQIALISWINLLSLPRRAWSSLVIVTGSAGVVGVIISVLAIGSGFNLTVSHTGRPDRAVVLRGGSASELASMLDRSLVPVVLSTPGIKQGRDGSPLASADAVVIETRPFKRGGTSGNVTLRGMSANGLAVRPEIELVEGRLFHPGLYEMIVGRSAQARFGGLDVGDRITFHNSEWTIVGAFESNQDSHESEILADGEAILTALHRSMVNSVTVVLDSPGSFTAFKEALTTNPQLSVEVWSEPDYVASLSKWLLKLMNFIAYVVGGIMAIGAVFGALNTMYSAISARTVEIATLRALGFSPLPIVVSVLVEAVTLSLTGALIGASAAWLLFNGHTVNTLGGNFTQIVFHLTVTPSLIMKGIIWACVIGMIGGAFPAFRAARLPVAAALRSV